MRYITCRERIALEEQCRHLPLAFVDRVVLYDLRWSLDELAGLVAAEEAQYVVPELGDALLPVVVLAQPQQILL